MPADVVVVGAGAAGMACARSVSAAGLSAVVLEARDRVGGRMLTAAAPDAVPMELGAQVVHGDRAACWDFMGDAATARYSDQAPLSVHLAGSLYPAFTLVRSAGCLLWLGDERVRKANAADLPVSELLPRIGARQGIDDEWMRQTWAADPSELSARGMANVLHAADSGQGEFLLGGGFSALADRMAAGVDIRLGCPAQVIEWEPGAVRVRARDDEVVAAACVVTAPPPVCASGRLRIASLPESKQRAAAALRLGDAVSVAVTLTERAGGAAMVFDAEGEAGFWRTSANSPVALGVAKSAAAQRLRAAITDRDALRELVGRLIPWTRDASVEEVDVADWGHDPWALGAFTFPRAGQLDQSAIWAEPLGGTIFFAGEATCGARHPASVHGAIESGRRAATEVIGVFNS